jgi:NAD(P)H-dependent flavin oxidoreductase YrpB (nitropropane dioxygenase family)
VIDGDIEGGSLMAGQSVGFVTRGQSTAEIIEELVSQALAVLAARSQGMRQLVSREILAGSQAPADV